MDLSEDQAFRAVRQDSLTEEAKRAFRASGGMASQELRNQESNVLRATAGMTAGQRGAQVFCKEGGSDFWQKGVTGTFKAGVNERAGMDRKDELATIADAYSVRRYGSAVSGSAELQQFNE